MVPEKDDARLSAIIVFSQSQRKHLTATTTHNELRFRRKPYQILWFKSFIQRYFLQHQRRRQNRHRCQKRLREIDFA